MTKYPTSESKQVVIPSKMKTRPSTHVFQEHVLHRHPLYPLIPFILPIALAKRPPNAPARVVELKKKVNRF